jgi:hypothetical protein
MRKLKAISHKKYEEARTNLRQNEELLDCLKTWLRYNINYRDSKCPFRVLGYPGCCKLVCFILFPGSRPRKGRRFRVVCPCHLRGVGIATRVAKQLLRGL